MIHVTDIADFENWRASARNLLAREISPEQVVWTGVESNQPVLDELFAGELPETSSPAALARVPRAFVETARTVSYHRDPARWSLLYRILWRLSHGEHELLRIIVDEDVQLLENMEKSVRRDIHKMHAFVRFRKVQDDLGEHYIAWHRPDHLIVPAVGPWFARRFPQMRWSILTPDASVSWDFHELSYGPGMERTDAPADDELERLWCTYYAAIFNPNRVKVAAMKKEMAVRHWPTLPETQLIPQLLHEASRRANTMIKQARNKVAQECENTGTAEPFIPAKLELPVLKAAVQKCRGCDLYCNATQGVFGEGLKSASLMFVGEQPGDQEDLSGKPFVGPSGQLLDKALEEAGIARKEAYVTNAVKHFKFEPRGKRRIHAKPNAREINACRPWLEAEIKLIQPKLIVCLGATAAQSLMGREFRITRDRGKLFTETQWGPGVIATTHPSAILRAPDPAAREESYKAFVHDLKIVKKNM